jgi:hypothetical protein
MMLHPPHLLQAASHLSLSLLSAAQLISGLTYPRVTFLAGIAYIVGRGIYSSGYRTQGPSGRAMGARIFDVALLVLLVTAVMSCVEISGGVAGISKFARSYVS